jgi:glycosyltransferase involved in cell wall biosynthesis
MRAIIPRADGVIAVCDAQRADLERRGCDWHRARVIANGVDETELRPTRSRAATRAALGCREDDFVALMAASLRPEKHPERFVASAQAAAQRNRRIRGFLAGDGMEAERVRVACARSQGVVRLLGPRTDMGDLISAADALVLPSAAEAMPMIVLEAMALARPVIGSATGALPTMLEDGRSGLLIEPAWPGGGADVHGLAQALLALSRNRARARSLGLAARARQRRCFSAARMADDYAEAIRQVAFSVASRKHGVRAVQRVACSPPSAGPR